MAYPCSIKGCRFRFKDLYHAVHHKNAYHLKPGFACRKCYKIMHSLRDYKDHMLAHRRGNMVNCKICFAAYHKNHILKHEMSHRVNKELIVLTNGENYEYDAQLDRYKLISQTTRPQKRRRLGYMRNGKFYLLAGKMHNEVEL